MRFKAKYIPQNGNGEVYYRTVFAYSVNDATKRAEQFVKKGYILASVIQEMGY